MTVLYFWVKHPASWELRHLQQLDSYTLHAASLAAKIKIIFISKTAIFKKQKIIIKQKTRLAANPTKNDFSY